MSKFVVSVTITLLLVIYLTGCGAHAKSPLTGFLYSDVTVPVPSSIDNNVKPLKSGTAFAQSILGWVAIGDASIRTAARNGGITKIHHVEQHSQSVLGIVATYTVTVYGE